MKANPLKEGVLTENSAGIGTVTRKMVRERAVELAAINGRPPQESVQIRLGTGQTGIDRRTGHGPETGGA